MTSSRRSDTFSLVRCALDLIVRRKMRLKKLVVLSCAILLSFVCSCRENTESSFVGEIEFSYNGLQLELPQQGRGGYSVSTSDFEYKWGGKKIRIKDDGNGGFTITTPFSSGIHAEVGDRVVFTDTGRAVINAVKD